MNTVGQHRTEEEFFYALLRKTETVFKDSATRNKYPNENWNFAICDTPNQIGQGLFFGLNWGGQDIDKQTVYSAKYKKRNWKFVSHTRSNLQTYFNEEVENLNYSNLCFFRSPDLDHFIASDWELAVPLFQEYVEYVQPPWALMLGKPPKLLRQHITDLETIHVTNKYNGRRVFGYSGKLFEKYPFGAVPHPEARVSTKTRLRIWDEIANNRIKPML